VYAPADFAGNVAVIKVLLTTVTPVAAVPPTDTVAPDTKPVPVIVTDLPAKGPVVGDTVATVGAALYVNVTLLFDT